MKYENIVKRAEAEAQRLAENAIFTIADSTAEAQTLKDIISLLLFADIKKQLENKETKLILDCDYDRSRSADKETSFDYYHIISTDKTADNKLQLKRDSKDKYHFNISVKYLEQLENSDFEIKVKRDKQNRAKNIRVNTTYDSLKDCFTTLQAILKAEQSDSTSAE